MKAKNGFRGLTGLRREYSHRISLTLLFVGTVFLVLVAMLVVVMGLALILTNVLGIHAETGLDDVDTNSLIVVIILISLAVGIAFSFLFGRLFMKPVNTIINMMNRIASGHFETRLAFRSVMSRHPTVAELTDSINTMASELQNTEMLRSDFINNFSHEFKTPIVSIAGFAKLLQRADLDGDQRREYIDAIVEESRRLSDMATNVLKLTKVENQAILTGVSRYNLSEQLRSAVLLLEDQWTAKHLELDMEFPEVSITANEDMLREVWINLVQNAVKYSPDYGPVQVCVEDGQSAVRVRVANSGEIAPEHLEVCVDNPFDYLGEIQNAGSVFLGRYNPEPMGDYFAGPNHTLPTMGTARFYSPLSVDDFVKKSQFSYYTRDALARDYRKVSLFARKEGLDAHARAVDIRFEGGEA